MGLQYLRDQTGPLSMAPSTVGAFGFSSKEEQINSNGYPNIEWHLQALSLK